jgi:selenocysteine-specific elongation factor
MRVIGTAGHVDHGKSTLVRRLTGIDPDRLAEEKAREMTIDLGFAWLKMPDDSVVGIVDVPGHRDFIENMLAGVGGIDAVLLVIAADEGVMPQTREHLAILNLLGIEHGIVVLTKTDMVDDTEWLELVQQEIRDVLQGTTLADAPIVPVSAHTGAGIDALITSLAALLAELPSRPDYGTPRLPIDRVFTMSGFGTVVTGTLTGGALRVGDEVELFPDSIAARVRGLQSYKQSVTLAYPGSRVAVNLSGVDKQRVTRGAVLALPDSLHSSTLVDVWLRYLNDAPRPLLHNAEVKVFAGTTECSAHVRLLNDEQIAPGQDAWVQLRLDRPLALAQGDRYIIRFPSPAETVGGGLIVNPTPAHRWRRFQARVIDDLKTRMAGTPAQRVAQAAPGPEPSSRAALQKATGYASAELDAAVQAALDEHLLVPLGGGYLALTAYNGLLRQLHDMVDRFHAQYPLRAGIPREELRSRLGVKQATLQLLLDSQTEVRAQGAAVKHEEHEIRFTPSQERAIEEAQKRFREAPYAPPSYAETASITGEDVLRALVERGDLVQIAEDVLLSAEIYGEMTQGALAIIDAEGTVSAKALRDRFNTSRKYAIALLEYLDSQGITRRVGDERVRGKNAPI